VLKDVENPPLKVKLKVLWLRVTKAMITKYTHQDGHTGVMTGGVILSGSGRWSRDKGDSIACTCLATASSSRRYSLYVELDTIIIIIFLFPRIPTSKPLGRLQRGRGVAAVVTTTTGKGKVRVPRVLRIGGVPLRFRGGFEESKEDNGDKASDPQ
jgi:hypothetical protein